MSFRLGTKPETMTLVLCRGADFASTLHNTEDDWPVTAEITLSIGNGHSPVTWTSTLAGPDATFSETSDTVDALIKTKPTKVKLYYVDGSIDVLWAVGSVEIDG